MNKSKVIKGLYQVIVDNDIDKHLDRQATAIATSLYAMLESVIWLNTQPKALLFDMDDKAEEEGKVAKREENAEIEAFVEEMYKLYPTKCPKRNSSLGKSKRDKLRIKALLKQYSKEDIEKVIRHEVDSNYGVNYMKNFSTFLNNFPDPSTLDGNVGKLNIQQNGGVIINGTIYK